VVNLVFFFACCFRQPDFFLLVFALGVALAGVTTLSFDFGHAHFLLCFFFWLLRVLPLAGILTCLLICLKSTKLALLDSILLVMDFVAQGTAHG
jgi:hypothetical protein